VTIGVPVHNEGPFVAEAIRSAALQPASVIVSDNASTDATPEVCVELASRHPNITFVRHPVNLGASWNFGYCLECARTPFFMWLGGHDIVPAGYCEELLATLGRSGALLAYSDAHHLDRSGRLTDVCSYDFRDRTSSPDPWVRVFALVTELALCTLLHGLWRTADLRACYEGQAYLGSDHVLLCRAAARGQFAFSIGTYYGRRFTRGPEEPAEAAQRRLRTMLGDAAIATLPTDPHHVMQDAILRIANDLPAPTPWSRWRRRLAVRQCLSRRFGRY
jgi:glycosyltransferase involved in cell wall biosynthesis